MSEMVVDISCVDEASRHDLTSKLRKEESDGGVFICENNMPSARGVLEKSRRAYRPMNPPDVSAANPFASSLNGSITTLGFAIPAPWPRDPKYVPLMKGFPLPSLVQARSKSPSPFVNLEDVPAQESETRFVETIRE